MGLSQGRHQHFFGWPQQGLGLGVEPLLEQTAADADLGAGGEPVVALVPVPGQAPGLVRPLAGRGMPQRQLALLDRQRLEQEGLARQAAAYAPAN